MGIMTKTNTGMKTTVRKNGTRRVQSIPIGKTMTEQSHKNTTDINKIIEKYDKNGILTHVNSMDGIKDNMLTASGADFKTAMDLITAADTNFARLPLVLKQKFKNSPEKLLDFVNNPDNHQEAFNLGLRGDAPTPPDPPAAPPAEAPEPTPE